MADHALLQLLRESFYFKVVREDKQATEECRALSRHAHDCPVPRYPRGEMNFGTGCTYFVWPNAWFRVEQCYMAKSNSLLRAPPSWNSS